MLTKYLISKIEGICAGIEGENNDAFDLEYYVVESGNEDAEADPPDGGYGLEIVKRNASSKLECSLIENIYCKRDVAISMAEKLAANAVTPVTLQYIIEDSLGI